MIAVRRRGRDHGGMILLCAIAVRVYLAEAHVDSRLVTEDRHRLTRSTVSNSEG